METRDGERENGRRKRRNRERERENQCERRKERCQMKKYFFGKRDGNFSRMKEKGEGVKERGKERRA